MCGRLHGLLFSLQKFLLLLCGILQTDIMAGKFYLALRCIAQRSFSLKASLRSLFVVSFASMTLCLAGGVYDVLSRHILLIFSAKTALFTAFIAWMILPFCTLVAKTFMSGSFCASRTSYAFEQSARRVHVGHTTKHSSSLPKEAASALGSDDAPLLCFAKEALLPLLLLLSIQS